MKKLIPILLLVFLAACATAPVPAPYPHESVLTVLGELKIFLNQDPYKDPPGRDLQGRNIYRVTLERLDNLKPLVGPEYGDVIAFARGECLERLGDWNGAVVSFDAVSGTSTSLAAPSYVRAKLARRMGELTNRAAMGKTLESYLNDLEVLGRNFDAWTAEQPGFPYAGFIATEKEHALEEQVKLLSDNRLLLERGMPRAVELGKRLVEQNTASWLIGEHDLLLGNLFEMMGRDITTQTPPEGAEFKADPGWNNLIEQARSAYTRAAQRDGDAAKPEAQARLRALDAYALRVQSLAK